MAQFLPPLSPFLCWPSFLATPPTIAGRAALKAALRILRRSPERFDEQWLQLPLLKAAARLDSPVISPPAAC
jgi:hypothetical protein